MKTKKKYGGVTTRSQTKKENKEKVSLAKVSPEDLLEKKKPGFVMKLFEEKFDEDISIVMFIEFYKTVFDDFLFKKSSSKSSSSKKYSEQSIGIFQCIFSENSPLFKLIEFLNKSKKCSWELTRGNLLNSESDDFDDLVKYFNTCKIFIELNFKYAKKLKNNVLSKKDFLINFIEDNIDNKEYIKLLDLNLEDLIINWYTINNDKNAQNLKTKELIEKLSKPTSLDRVNFLWKNSLKVEGFTNNNVLVITDEIFSLLFSLYKKVNNIFKKYKNEHNILYERHKELLEEVEKKFPSIK